MIVLARPDKLAVGRTSVESFDPLRLLDAPLETRKSFVPFTKVGHSLPIVVVRPRDCGQLRQFGQQQNGLVVALGPLEVHKR